MQRQSEGNNSRKALEQTRYKRNTLYSHFGIGLYMPYRFAGIQCKKETVMSYYLKISVVAYLNQKSKI